MGTSIDGEQVSSFTLESAQSTRAIGAHRDKASVVLPGDLERGGRRLCLLNACVTDVGRGDVVTD